MADIRESFVTELQRRRWTVHHLAMKMDHQVSATALYRFARGEVDPSRSVLNCVLTFLDLEIVPRQRVAARAGSSRSKPANRSSSRKRVPG